MIVKKPKMKLELHKNSNGPSSFSVWCDGELLGNLEQEIPRKAPDTAIHPDNMSLRWVFRSLDGEREFGFSRNCPLDKVLTDIRKAMAGQ